MIGRHRATNCIIRMHCIAAARWLCSRVTRWHGGNQASSPSSSQPPQYYQLVTSARVTLFPLGLTSQLSALIKYFTSTHHLQSQTFQHMYFGLAVGHTCEYMTKSKQNIGDIISVWFMNAWIHIQGCIAPHCICGKLLEHFSPHLLFLFSFPKVWFCYTTGVQYIHIMYVLNVLYALNAKIRAKVEYCLTDFFLTKGYPSPLADNSFPPVLVVNFGTGSVYCGTGWYLVVLG